jgi:hypothetical protein
MRGSRFQRTEGELSGAQLGKWFWGILLICSCGLTAFEFIRRIYQWLRYANVDDYLVSTFLKMPTLKWVGMQRIVEFVWGLPILAVAIALMMISGYLWNVYDEEVGLLEKKLADKKAGVIPMSD